MSVERVIKYIPGKLFVAILLAIALDGCHPKPKSKDVILVQEADSGAMGGKLNCCSSGLPSRPFMNAADTAQNKSILGIQSNSADMVLIPGGRFLMGGDSRWGRPDEFPLHEVNVSSFYMDKNEVTNAQFRAFVHATAYVTTAERKPDWEELKKQLPAGTPRPADSLLVAASLVFTPPSHPVSLNNVSQWWKWIAGADWRHPQGPKSTIDGKDSYPVVQVSWDDANAYASWAGKRLPTEAEWEYAARGGKPNSIYPWGNQPIDQGELKANSWQGHFPNINSEKDHYSRAAPVMTFPPNDYGLFDMAGNVWEWCSDWYRSDYYAICSNQGIMNNPQGSQDSFDPQEPTVPKRVVRGGSFLCTDQYCSGFRVAARMKTSPDTSLEHTGFRCVISGN